MRVQTGIDIIEISRIQRLIENSGGRFLSKHFTDNEIEYCNSKDTKHYAGMFAAKEAAYKALKLKWETGFIWKNIEITHNPEGNPEIILYGTFKEHFENNNYSNIDISISYAGDYATASATVLQLQA